MRKAWALVVAGLALIGTAGAAEAVSNLCPDNGGTAYIVDTVADANDIAAGYTNNACDLIIKVSVTPTLDEIFLRAKSITVDPGPGGGPLNIIDNINDGSKVHLLAVNNIVIANNSVIKAPKEVEIKCSAPGCTITITDSTVISSLALQCGDFTGEVDIEAKGDIFIENSNVWGGKFLYIVSNQGNVTWHCGAGGPGCKDPNVAPIPAIILSQCEDPANPGTLKFPCTGVTFQNAAELREVCFPVEQVCCGGAEAEVHLFTGADKTLDIEGSTLDLRGKIRIRTGILKANGVQIPDPANPGNTADNITITVFGSTTVTPVQLENARIKAQGFITIAVNTCPDPAVLPCVDADFAEIIGPKNAGAQPTLNGDNTQPYDPNVKDTAFECGPDPALTVNPGKYPTINAAATTGLISVCGATLNEP